MGKIASGAQEPGYMVGFHSQAQLLKARCVRGEIPLKHEITPEKRHMC